MNRIVGVESAYGFGDCVFNVPLIKQLSIMYDHPIGVAVQAQCADAYANIPWISEIVHITNLHEGVTKLQQLGYGKVIQITQNVKFHEFIERHSDHSLIDTPLWTGRQLGLPDFNQKPIFLPTPQEEAISIELGDQLAKPTIAIECIAKSSQSWADSDAINTIVEKYVGTHTILWLSNQGAPQHQNVHDLLQYSRRQILTLLRHCQIFFSVGSGFFCGMLSLPPEHQPRKTVCLWIDEFYKYEKRLNELKWADIIWVHNHHELKAAIDGL